MVKTSLALIGTLVIGMIIGGLVTWAVVSSGDPEPQVLEGYTTAVNADGTAIGLSEQSGGAGEGYVIAGATWRGVGGAWHDTFPTCLEPQSSGNRVRLGILQTEPTEDGPGRPVVVWLQCLD